MQICLVLVFMSISRLKIKCKRFQSIAHNLLLSRDTLSHKNKLIYTNSLDTLSLTMRDLFIIFCFIASLIPNAMSQVVYTEPEFPSQLDDVTIYFDATKGNAGLAGFTGEVYAHTGVITSTSTSVSDWKYVQGEWGTSNAPLMTRVSPDLYTLEMNIEDFYSIPTGQVVEQLAFVFRSQDGSESGRDTDGSDIYAQVYASNQGLIVSLISPAQEGSIIFDDESVSLKLNVNQVADVSVFDNSVLIHEENTDALDLVLSDLTLGEHNLEILINDGTEQLSVTTSVFVLERTNVLMNPPAEFVDGVNYYTAETYVFQLTAPHKDHAFFLCPANQFKVDLAYRMNLSTDDATFWIELPRSDFDNGNNTYQYLVDGSITIADPYSEVVLDPSNDQWVADEVMNTLPEYPVDMTTGIVTVFDTTDEEYPWTGTLSKPAKTDLVIYEILMRDFLEDHSYSSLLDTLDYLHTLGVNAIELMPVNEFEGNQSWGYNPSFHMALDKYYGTRDQFKAVIDAAHSRGMAVILDVVYNHVFSQSPLAQMFWDAQNFRPASDNPWLNVEAKHPFNVGYDVNHQSFETKQWVKRVTQYWIEEYRIDGFRFDLSKGFTQFDSGNNSDLMAQYDASRIEILKEYADHIWSVDADSYVILEHFGGNVEEEELSDHGMMLWGNGQHQFAEAAMGYSSDLDWLSYKQRGWNDPHVVGYAESHDEERMLYKLEQFGNSGTDHNTKEPEVAYDRAEAANAVFFSIPGPKMMWQFQELGYDYSINYCVNGGNSNDCRLDPKPIRWDYAEVEGRRQIYAVISAMTHLKATYPTFATTDYEFLDQSYFKRIKLNYSEMNAVTIANFRVESDDVDPSFQSTGTWYEYFTGDSLIVTDVNQNISLTPGEYRIYTDKRISPPESFYVGTADIPVVNVELYPNPIGGAERLSLRHSDLSDIREISILDQMGKKSAMSYGYDGSVLSLDAKDVGNSGIYYIRIVTSNKIYVARVVRI